MLHDVVLQLVVRSISIPEGSVRQMLQRIRGSICSDLAHLPAIPALGRAEQPPPICRAISAGARVMRHRGPATARYQPGMLSWATRPWPPHLPSLVLVHHAIHSSEMGHTSGSRRRSSKCHHHVACRRSVGAKEINCHHSATASDNAGVTPVEFYVNGRLTCADITGGYICAYKVPSVSGRRNQLLFFSQISCLLK
jgi:hypothetical protein